MHSGNGTRVAGVDVSNVVEGGAITKLLHEDAIGAHTKTRF